MIPQTFKWLNSPSYIRGFDDPLIEKMREHWDMLEQEINCWRMYGYTVEFVMDELILTRHY